MNKMLLLGCESVGQAAIDADITSAYGYPGTPSTEIFEYIEKVVKRKHPDITAAWAANEKVAYEQALGVSYVGKRAIVTMKHVGINVAADAFMNSAITGANGGLVLAVADDPGMHSSQNEQDSRFYANFAKILCFEPSNQQMAYDMTKQAFDISERFGIPVMLRLVTRLAHSRAGVITAEKREQNKFLKKGSASDWTLLPSNAKVQYKKLLDKQSLFQEFSESSQHNKLYINDNNREFGIITSGIAYNYVRENYVDSDMPSYLRINVYPLPEKKIKKLLSHVKKVLIVEEGYPFIENTLLGVLGKTESPNRFQGRFNGFIPLSGELNADIVAKALNPDNVKNSSNHAEIVKPRPPQLCPGCPHADLFKALRKAVSGYDNPALFGDIGCYTLGFYKPFNAIESCVDMGASVGMCKGASDAGQFPAVAIIGDSTFGHSGITPLLTAAHENSNMVLIIADNSTVAMTGNQKSATTGEYLINLLKGLGIDPAHIRVINPLPKYHDENVNLFIEEIEYKGLSVVISKRPCVMLKRH